MRAHIHAQSKFKKFYVLNVFIFFGSFFSANFHILFSGIIISSFIAVWFDFRVQWKRKRVQLMKRWNLLVGALIYTWGVH